MASSTNNKNSTNNKMYVVKRDNEELETFKTLSAAKKLADTEKAEVYCDGKCVYRNSVSVSVDDFSDNAVKPISEEMTENTLTPSIVAEKPRQSEIEEVKTERYRLKSLMNVRKRPSLDSTIVAVRAEGTVVRVLKIENDWMCLADGHFILYGGGKFAEKIE